VNTHDEQFFKAMGAHISRARREKGLTQRQVADQLGIARQTCAHYEVGNVRVPASMLPLLGQMLGQTPNDLLGHSGSPRTSKPGPRSRLDRQIERIRQLSRTKQLAIQGAGSGRPFVHDDPSPPELRG